MEDGESCWSIDFDNTIADYDRLFHRLACERNLIPELPATKRAVRDSLRAGGREAIGRGASVAYGPRITEAEPFDGVKPFRAMLQAKSAVAIAATRLSGHISDSSTCTPRHIPSNAQVYETSVTGLSPNQVFLELTLSAKLSESSARVHRS